MGVFSENAIIGASAAGGYDIERSVVLDTNSYFTRTPSSAGNRKTWTISAWVKIANLASTNPSPYNIIFSASGSSDQDVLYFESDDTLVLGLYASDPTVNMQVFKTSALFRDISAWYHIVVSCDTTAGSNYVKLYINGEEVTDFSTDNRNNAALSNHDTEFNNTYQHRIGKAPGSDYLNAYLAEFNWIDGQALTPASFGETNADTNQWQAIKYTGSYGTNGFFLDFATRATDPIDASGNGNNFSSVNVIAGDWKIDSPTNNFSTLNPLYRGDSKIGLKEGNLKANASGESSVNALCASTLSPSNSKWYCEFYCKTLPGSDRAAVGIADTDNLNVYTNGNSGNTVMIATANDNRYWDFGTEYDDATGVAQVVAGDIVQFAWDVDTGKVWIGINNTWQGASSPNPSTATSPLATHATVNSWIPIVRFSTGATASNLEIYFNAGQDSSFAGNKTAQGNGGVGEDFYYTPPTGYKALNTNNLSDPNIADPTKHFNTKLWTSTSADGTSALGAVTGVGFQPDLVWAKGRTAAWDHSLFNSVMGTGLGKALYTNTNFVAGAYDTSGYGNVTSFDSDGFTVGLTAGNNYAYNYGSGAKYLAWNWKAGGTAVSNTDGSITSSVSANTTAGFSIVSYTGNSTAGATVGHGLSQAPELVIAKERTNADSWLVFSEPLGNTKALFLNESSVPGTHITYWNDTSPSSTVVTLGSDNKANGSGTIIMYCFHSVEGYSKVGSYTGNGSTDGSFIHTGFRPAWVMIKRSSSAENWVIMDNKRNTYNWVGARLYPDLNNAEGSSETIDFVSNGFKMRSTNSITNAASTYIYLAIAESPFKTSNAR